MLLPNEPIYPVYKDDMENTNKIKKEENVHAKVVSREIIEEEAHEYILLAVEEQKKE